MIIELRHRVILSAVSLALAAVAVVVPFTSGGSLTGLQVLAAVVAVPCFAAAPYFRGPLVGAMVAVGAEVALALPSTEFPVVAVPIAGVSALAAGEGLNLARVWRSRGVLTWDAERSHARAGAERTGLGAAAAGLTMALGGVALPSPVVISVVGIVATGAVIWVLAERST